jgi:hypothetical protein
VAANPQEAATRVTARLTGAAASRRDFRRDHEEHDMGFTDDILADVQRQIAADDDVLAEARTRLNLVLEIAVTFPGARRAFRSGSLPVHTFNDPVTDGDGGVVLYPRLGPDGSKDIPNDIVADMCAHLGPKLRASYPNARCHTSKRGPKLLFGQSMRGQNPTVDLVVAMDRRDGAGLWIPHLEKRRWDASHPEEHLRLLNAEPVSLRRLRRRVIRLLKAWNKQYGEPALSSFHLSVLALMYVEAGMGVGVALKTVFEKATKHLETGANTKDPAQVSQPIRLLLSRSVAVDRLRKAAEQMSRALDNDDSERAVRSALSRVFRKYVDAPAGDALPSKMRSIQGAATVSPLLLGMTATAPAVGATRRAYGSHPR